MKKTISKRSLEEQLGSSYLSGSSAPYVEGLYEAFLRDPTTVDTHWRDYFSSLSASDNASDVSHADVRAQFRALAHQPRVHAATQTVVMPAVSDAAPHATPKSTGPVSNKQGFVDGLITAYRRFGHLNAKIDPLGLLGSPDPRLQLDAHELSEADLDSTFATHGLLPSPQASLRDIVAALKSAYCGTMGVEYSRISNEAEREWLREYIEARLPVMELPTDIKRRILRKLVSAAGLEKYLDVKYPGQKRFSVEGGESIIPMLDEMTHQARPHHIEEIVIGMAHRGRLNVLLNIMGQEPRELFQEFDGTKDYGMTSGDVKYHQGFSSDVQTPSGPMHLSLAFNPSHLEFICPVVTGSVRARQERNHQRQNGHKHNYAMAVLIHGDASFAGQGVVMETLNMSQTRAYHIGGAIHIVLNNQVGFTTSNPEDARSSRYCTDIAKMIDAPVLHVNGDDPEAVVKAMQLAIDFRMAFNKDIVIDLVCYRRHGHQEVDEPRATQPLMYKRIDEHPGVKNLYAKQLIEEGVVTQQEVDEWSEEYRSRLDQGERVVDVMTEGLSQHYAANWTPYIDRPWTEQVDTAVPRDKLMGLGIRICTIPENFELQRNVNMIMRNRAKMTAGELPLDWGYAETMAYATLLDEGWPIRFSGEDVRRGTFFHRHAVLFDQNTGEEYMPLAHLNDRQEKMHIFDSLLSEAGAMGFEYGYSTSDPNALIIWEAQFGDFANGAQVYIDQFISSGWQKWNRLSGLVLLLPHGYEGMGPEHSSARLERYLQLCAQYNIQVCVPSTPAQMFHLLRRQVLRPYRKPLIVMTPKSLLRHKLAVSSLDDLAQGQLQLVIPEIDEDINARKVKRVVLCSGKVYYELLAMRRERGIHDIAIVRIEQLYPFPFEELAEVFTNYRNLKQVVWCQEEPKNQGAWFCTRDRLLKCMPRGLELRYAGRKSMAAPAGGYPSLHQKQQIDLVEQALNIKELQDVKLYQS